MRVVDLHGDALRRIPGHGLLVLADGLLLGPVRSAVELAVPEEGHRAPSDLDRVPEHLRPLHEIPGAGVATEEREVPGAARLVEGAEVFRLPNGDPARAGELLAHLLGPEETLLGVLVWGDGEDVEDACLRDLAAPRHRLLQGRAPEAVADQGRRRGPLNTLQKSAWMGFRRDLGHLPGEPAFDRRQVFPPGHAPIKRAQLGGDGRDLGRPPEHEPRGAELACHLRGLHLLEDRAPRLRSEAVAHRHDVRGPRRERLDESHHRRGRSEEMGFVPMLLRDLQEVDDAAGVDAVPHGGGEDPHSRPPAQRRRISLTPSFASPIRATVRPVFQKSVPSMREAMWMTAFIVGTLTPRWSPRLAKGTRLIGTSSRM